MAASSDPGGPDHTGDLRSQVIDAGRAAGLAAIGIGSGDILGATREDLEARRKDGLHAGMQFTYRNPVRSTDPSRIVAGARSLIVGAWSYRRSEAAASEIDHGSRPNVPRGRVATYARTDHYAELRAGLGRVASVVVDAGWKAKVVVDDNALVDRAAAHRAGLGWFGRNSLLLLPGRGSWCLLGSVVTDAPLEPTPPAGPTGHAQGCGTCTRCMTACPTGALSVAGVLDARRCLAWLVQAPGSIPVEHRVAMGDRIYGCDDCQEVCPINRLGDRRHEAPAAEAEQLDHLDLFDLLATSDEEMLATYGRWYVAERDPRYLRRNALVAIGNVGDPSDPDTLATLERWTVSDDALLAEHAQWALDRLDHRGRGGS